MDKIILANYHLPFLLALTLISIGCTINTVIKLPEIDITKFFKS